MLYVDLQQYYAAFLTSRKTRSQCWSNVSKVGPTLAQHWYNMSILLGYKSFACNDDNAPVPIRAITESHEAD